VRRLSTCSVDDEAGDADNGGGHGNDGTEFNHDHPTTLTTTSTRATTTRTTSIPTLGITHTTREDHSHDHDDSDHARGGATAPTRLQRVVDLVEEMGLPDDVTRDTLAIFEILGTAEAAVHGTDLDETHFHEVGADDAIADVVGACLLVDDLAVDRVVTTPLSVGSGEVEMSHGTYPIPAPAVVEIAEQADWSLRGRTGRGGTAHPTGAAILAHFAQGIDALPSMEVQASGYGAGGTPSRTARTSSGRSSVNPTARSSTTISPSSKRTWTTWPRRYWGPPSVARGRGGPRRLGAPGDDEEGRPGHLVKVICKPEDAQRVARRLAEETGTLGVREHGADHRWIAHREIETVAITVEGEAYPIDVKIASDDEGVVFDVSAEYDDAAAVADETGMAVRDVLRRAEDVVRDLKGSRSRTTLGAERAGNDAGVTADGR